jgi:hypothetical protein
MKTEAGGGDYLLRFSYCFLGETKPHRHSYLFRLRVGPFEGPANGKPPALPEYMTSFKKIEMNDLNPFAPALGKTPIDGSVRSPAALSDKSNFAQRSKGRQGRNYIAQRPVGN